jgi:hypothetical protein
VRLFWVSHRLVCVTMLCVVALLPGCERKAPSQEQCLDFAMRALRITDPRLLAVPAVSDKLDELVVKCLTTPYDKKLLECIKTRSNSRSCVYEFEDRDRRHRGTSQ